MKYLLIDLFIIFSLTTAAFPQQKITDSLLLELSKAATDSAQIDILNELTLFLSRSYPDSALGYAKKAVELATKTQSIGSLAQSYKNMGNIYFRKDTFYLSYKYYEKALEHYTNLGNMLGEAMIYNNMGALSRSTGDFLKSLEYYQKSLEIREKIGDRGGMGKTYNNIGNIHNSMGNFDIALRYYQKSLEIRYEFNDKLGMAGCYNNLGLVYSEKNNYKQALNHYVNALDIYTQFEDRLGISQVHQNMGISNLMLRNYEEAMRHLEKSLQINQQLGNRSEVSINLRLMAQAENAQKNYAKAKELAFQSIKIAKELKVINLLPEIYKQLQIAHKGEQQYNKALRYSELYSETKDSLYKLNKVKELQRLEAKYQFENNRLKIEKLERENDLNELQLEKLRITQILSIVILIIAILIIVALLMIRKKLQKKNQTIHKQNKKILLQKAELEKHRNRLEAEVETRTADLRVAKEKAEESDKLKTAFLANMSHEIRTPLNAIVGFSDLLASGNTAMEDNQSYAKSIRSNSNILINLINDLIDIAKIESGGFSIEKKQVDVYAISQELFNTFEREIIKNPDPVNLIFSPQHKKPLFTHTDENRIKQVMNNLLSNAVKFTENGEINFGYTVNNNEVVFYVKDTGLGIPENKQGELFKRFTKIDHHSKRFFQGTGLGLAISKHIVEALGGKIWFSSKAGEGSIFYFSLPLSN